jgi:hypothetical protein
MELFEYEVRYISAALDELENYLLSDELFWPLVFRAGSLDQSYPRLTLGGLLLAKQKITSNYVPQLNIPIHKYLLEIDMMRQKWQIMWGKKAHREWQSRLNQWKNYLNELRQSPEKHIDYFPYEVRWRVILELLGNDYSQIPEEEIELLRGMDLMLKALFVPGEFIWEASLQTAFPEPKFWFLYGKPSRSLGVPDQ